ncbi:MAG: type II toxin-antitoxin system VapC family toxin [Allorhizobium sp.]
MYLLDTNVISEFRKINLGQADPKVERWTKDISPEIMYLSAVNIFELDFGIIKRGRRDAEGARELQAWLDDVVIAKFRNRILAFGLDEARICASLWVDRTRPYRDAMIAATAIKAGLTLVTRNTVDFKDMNVPLINPWDA